VGAELLDRGTLPGDKHQTLLAISSALEKVHETTGLPYARLEEAAIHGLLDALDPHSSLLSTEVAKELQVEIQGAFGGIGLQLSVENKALTVISPIDDTPAYQAGLKSGDRIVRINGESTDGMSINEAVNRLRGEKSSRVTLAVMREGWEGPRDFELTRDIVTVKSLRTRMLAAGIGYVRISQFISTTGDDLEDALIAMGARFGRMRGLVIDLRNNSGGMLEVVTEVADKFIEAELICSLKGRAKNSVQRFTGQAMGSFPPFPIIVLINEGSASGAEIIAGALKDLDRAVIIGKRTFGKGSVQSIFLLPDKRQLRLTTAQYYLPSGQSVQGGIVTHVEVGEQEGADIPLRLAESTFQAASRRPGVVTNDQLKTIALELNKAEARPSDPAMIQP
jgi:carboxyl-terminal processing protease